jgi:polysaccharide biosynthesis protein PslH
MRILILTNKMPYPPRDGGSIASLSLALSLSDCGNEVEILSMNTSKHHTNLKSIPQEIKSKINFYSVDINTETSAIKAGINLIFSSKPYNAQRFISTDFDNKLSSILQEKDFDIIQLEGLYLCPYIETIRKNSKGLIALRSHNIEHEIWHRAAVNESNRIIKSYKKNLASRIHKFKLAYLNRYDLLVPITARDGELYNKFGNDKPVHVVPTGINSDNHFLNCDTTNSEFPGFFHIGALDWIPNQEGLTWFIEKVWREYIKTDSEAIFTVAGRNAPVFFEKYLLQNNIQYLGEVENAADFIESGSVMIVPLLSGSGMRIKIIEGMAAGKTIITTSIGTEGINTENGKNIIIADTPVEFMQALQNIKNNRNLHDKISIEARKFIIENFDNNNIAQNLAKFYQSQLK